MTLLRASSAFRLLLRKSIAAALSDPIGLRKGVLQHVPVSRPPHLADAPFGYTDHRLPGTERFPCGSDPFQLGSKVLRLYPLRKLTIDQPVKEHQLICNRTAGKHDRRGLQRFARAPVEQCSQIDQIPDRARSRLTVITLLLDVLPFSHDKGIDVRQPDKRKFCAVRTVDYADPHPEHGKIPRLNLRTSLILGLLPLGKGVPGAVTVRHQIIGALCVTDRLAVRKTDE